MNYIGFIAGQLVVVVVSWAYWMAPGNRARDYWPLHKGQHIGDAGVALFVFVAWGDGLLVSLSRWAGLDDLADGIPSFPEGVSGGFIAGGVCSVLAWILHARWKSFQGRSAGGDK